MKVNLMSNQLLGIGLYTSMEASRLVGTSARTISNWLKGYSYTDVSGNNNWINPLWKPDLETGFNDQVQMSFRDLMEIRFIESFRKAGLSLQKIRFLYNQISEIIEDERPFSTARFRTDGNTIFFEREGKDQSEKVMFDLSDYQFVFRKFIEPTFKDIDYEGGFPVRWWPQKNNKQVVIDPKRSFGQPIIDDYGIPTSTIYSIYLGTGESFKGTSDYFEIPIHPIKNAVSFEKRHIGS